MSEIHKKNVGISEEFVTLLKENVAHGIIDPRHDVHYVNMKPGEYNICSNILDKELGVIRIEDIHKDYTLNIDYKNETIMLS